MKTLLLSFLVISFTVSNAQNRFSKDRYKSLKDFDLVAHISESQPDLDIEAETIEKLQSKMRYKEDRFANANEYWFRAGTWVTENDYNGLNLYFKSTDWKPHNLRMSLFYSGQDWLFFDTVKIKTDSGVYTYQPENLKDKVQSGRVNEWFDDELYSDSKEMIEAMANASKIEIQFIGDRGTYTKKISNRDLKDFKRSWQFYKAMGGTL